MRRWKVVASLLFAWFVILVYISSSLIQVDVTPSMPVRDDRLQKAIDELERLRVQNQQLKTLAGHISDDDLENFNQRKVKELAVNFDKTPDVHVFHGGQDLRVESQSGPSSNHENTRRKLTSDVTEWWWYMRSQLTHVLSLTSDGDTLSEKLHEILSTVNDYHRTVSNDLGDLAATDGGDDWRRGEGEELGRLVQERIRTLQNPTDCSNAKKIVCSLSKGCGYGCQLHHVTYCLIMAHATERVLILESRGWRYAHGGWETVFLPLSNTCTLKGSGTSKPWERSNKNTPVIELPIVDSLQPRPKQLPLSIPEDLAPRLTRLHGDPSTWWVGQFVKYLCRPQPALQQYINEMVKRFEFGHPIVGLQVRRTDKVGTEAAFHSVDEYMKHVEDYFHILSYKHNLTQKRVYLATDDSGVIKEARRKYPQYTFISDTSISKSASLGTRYSDSSLRGVILDIHLLSLTDYLVCTFSSQVCRVAYELMQTRHGDASTHFHSLDDIYYFGGQNAHNVRAIEPHSPRNPSEIGLEVGDLIGIAGNHWDGLSKGVNRRTGRMGVFPSYKVKDVIETASFPIQGHRRR